MLDSQENGTCATIFKLWKASLSDMRTADLDQSFDTAPPLELNDILHSPAEATLFRQCLIHCILRIIIKYGGPTFSKFHKELDEAQPVTSDKIEVHQTEIYPLPAWNIDESTIEGNAQVVEEIFKYLGLRDRPDFAQTVRILAGDQLSIARLRSLVNIRAGQEGGFNGFRWGAWMPGLFHAKIADCHGFFNTHWGKPNTGNRNPGSLWFHNSILHRLPITITSLPTFRTCRDLIFVSLYARVLNCFLLVTKADSLDDYVKPTTTFQDLYADAAAVYDRYTDTEKVSELRWERKCAVDAGKNPKEEKKGDMVFENAVLFLRDALITREFADAVKCGDSGRVVLVLKIWALSFRGNGRTKYAYEMLSIIHHLTRVWPEGLRKIILNNWLLDPTGNPNSFVEVDLVQEHLNFWIKNFYRAHGSNASWEWLETIAPCVGVLRHLTKSLNGLLGADLGIKHEPPDLTTDIDTLMASLRARGVYSLQPGRVLGDDDDSPAVDSISKGLEMLTENSKSPLTDYNSAFARLQVRTRIKPLVPVAAEPGELLAGNPSQNRRCDTPRNPVPPSPPSIRPAESPNTGPSMTTTSSSKPAGSQEAEEEEEDTDDEENELILLMDEEDEPTLERVSAEDVALNMDDDVVEAWTDGDSDVEENLGGSDSSGGSDDDMGI
ncbi:hypothetical protein VNI00_011521 [Paramarasmius palmivorus]|uniref:DUF6589 domain-containing protein n=1 Tax=Paramarasmius palmivorus TaxID=297713 RepID=A0AAW0CCB1_9AGAR